MERLKNPFILILLILTTLTAMACSEGDPTTSKAPWTMADCSEINAENVDDCIRMNQIQVIGTHNSYKQKPTSELIEYGNKTLPGWAKDIDYEHRSLGYQLQNLKVRQIELDIFADPDGGLYSEPAGALLTGDNEYIRHEAMMEPGFKVLHILDVDYRTTCLTFKECLTEIRDWSVNNPTHLPILVMVEMKDRKPDDWGDFSFTTPVTIDANLLFEVDAVILEIFENKHLITPDEIRGTYHTLEKAILTRGWPTLAQTKGRIMFALDNTGSHRDAYLEGNPNLQGRPLFVSSDPGEPTAAFIKMNNAIDYIDIQQEVVKSGYIIRTRSDIPVVEARFGNTYRREQALKSGAQYISTDYPEPAPFESGYMVTLPDTDLPGRCNPISAPQGCENSYIRE